MKLLYTCLKAHYYLRRIVQMLDIVLRIIGFIVWGFFSGLPFVVAPMIAILTSLAIMVAVRGIMRHTMRK